MYILQNTKTKEFFAEFSEHVAITTKDIDEAAGFEKASDAHLLIAHLHGNYEVVPKMQVVKQSQHARQ